MAWFRKIIQLLIRFSASFFSYDIKMLHGIWYEIGGLNQEISHSNLPQVIWRVFKSYRIIFRAVLWIVFEQLSSYLFVYWLLFEFTAEIYHLDFDSKLKDWIIRFLVETWERLSQEYIKSYRIAFRVALWLVFELLSSNSFVYWLLFSIYGGKISLEIWVEIEGLNQQISYWNLTKVIWRVFQVM